MSNVVTLPRRAVRPVADDGEAEKERYRAVLDGLSSDLESVMAALEQMRQAMLAGAERQAEKIAAD